MLQAILAFARENRKILHVLVQNTRAVDWIAEDVAAWFVEIESRDSQTNTKYATIRHAFSTHKRVRSMDGWGFAPGRHRIMSGEGMRVTIPPAPDWLEAEYKALRNPALLAAMGYGKDK